MSDDPFPIGPAGLTLDETLWRVLPAVLERVRDGLELAGDPSVKLKAMRMFKGMLKDQQWREQMLAQNRSEQEMGRKRSRDGDQAKNLSHYAASMPQKKN